jgi:hypothetical protein
MGPAKNPPQSGTSVRSPRPAELARDRARTFLLSFAEPGQRNRATDLVTRALGAISAAFRDLEHGEPKGP